MSAQTIAIPSHYKNNVIKRQVVNTTATVLTALVPVTDAITGRPENIFVQALSTNSGPITLGNSAVTAGGAGIELVAGANVNLPSNEIGFWFVVCASGTQQLNIVYQSGVN
jgi:hypothetical protein